MGQLTYNEYTEQANAMWSLWYEQLKILLATLTDMQNTKPGGPNCWRAQTL